MLGRSLRAFGLVFLVSSCATNDAPSGSDAGGSGSSSTTTASEGSGAITSASGTGESSAVPSSEATTAASEDESSSSDTSPPAGACDRPTHEAIIETYLDAVRSGDPAALPVSATVEYTVNDAPAELAAGQGLFETPIPVDFHRSFVDPTRCASFTEVISANAIHPYVLGVRIDLDAAGQIARLSVLATDEDDWLFNADNYLRYSSGEDWAIIPEDHRLPYERIADAGYLYFAYWTDPTAPVPWGMPCSRLEGGAYTGDGPNATCDIGIPDVALTPYDHIVDVEYGTSILFLNLGGPDTHMFRVLDTGIRYVHTLTATGG